MKFAVRQLTNWSLRSRLRKTKKKQRQFTLRLTLISVWQFLSRALVKETELQVWCTYDNRGRLWWSAYDPNTGRLIKQISEAQMRVWLEQRHLNY